MMPKIIENCCRIDAQNAITSSLGGEPWGLTFQALGLVAEECSGTWKMDVGIQKMSTGMWKMEPTSA